MAEFKAEPGHVLTIEETQDMLAYDEVGMPRPDRYKDVVFDATGIQGAVYRVRTDAEQAEADASATSAKEASDARAARLARVEEEKASLAAEQFGAAGMLSGAVNTGTRAVEGNTDVGATAGGDAGANTGGRADGAANRKSDK